METDVNFSGRIHIVESSGLGKYIVYLGDAGEEHIIGVSDDAETMLWTGDNYTELKAFSGSEVKTIPYGNVEYDGEYVQNGYMWGQAVIENGEIIQFVSEPPCG